MAIAADLAHNPSSSADRIERHAGVDRLFHWLTAFAVLTLMATGLLPRLGVSRAVTSGYLDRDEPRVAGWHRSARRERDGWAADLLEHT